MAGPVELLVDFGLVSALLVLAQLLRYRLAWLQALQLPAALVAGLIALALGPYGLKVLPFSVAANGAPLLPTYPSFLIAIVFACVGLARPQSMGLTRKTLEEIGDTFFFNLGCEVGQYAIAMAFGVLVLSPLFADLPPGFAILLPLGFAGGHGTAAAVAPVLEQSGWEGALPLAYTSATVGVAFAVGGGMALIHLGMRRGWTRFVRVPSEMPQSFRTGFIFPAGRPHIGEETTSAVAIDTLTWHLALAGSAVGMAYGVSSSLPKGHGIPLFALALIAALFIRFVFARIGLESFIDLATIRRIGGTATDYLVAFAVASIAVTIVLAYVVPLTILMLLGMAITLVQFRYGGPRMFRSYWFERSLFAFGWNTGVVATAITLVRVVDPEDRSRTLQDFGLAYPPISLVEVGIVTLLPQFVVRGMVIGPTLVLLAMTGATLVLSRVLLGWSRLPPAVPRPSEVVERPATVVAASSHPSRS
jgi:glutamate:Na+ symporter, ESS family